MKVDNLNDVLELFEKIGGRGKENCTFFAQTNDRYGRIGWRSY